MPTLRNAAQPSPAQMVQFITARPSLRRVNSKVPRFHLTVSPLHELPSWELTLPLIVAMLLASEMGYRIGCARHEQVRDAGRVHFNAVQASLLALLALLLGFTFNMANVRFDARRQGVLETANNFAALYLRSGDLPEPQRSDFRRFLREYLDTQADISIRQRGMSPEDLSARIARSAGLFRQMWEIVRHEAQGANPPKAIESLSTLLIDAQSLLRRRIFAYLNRVPDHILILLLAAGVGAAGVVGFSAGLGQHHGRFQTVALTVFVCGTIYVILELDRPLSGVQVDQTPLLQLREQWETGESSR